LFLRIPQRFSCLPGLDFIVKCNYDKIGHMFLLF
jgi:hypothetical protein